MVSGWVTAVARRRPLTHTYQTSQYLQSSTDELRWKCRLNNRLKLFSFLIFLPLALFLNAAICVIIPLFPRCRCSARFLCGYITRLCWLSCLLWCVFHHFVPFLLVSQQLTFQHFSFFNLRFTFRRVFSNHIFSLSGLLSPLLDHFVYFSRTCSLLNSGLTSISPLALRFSSLKFFLLLIVFFGVIFW